MFSESSGALDDETFLLVLDWIVLCASFAVDTGALK